MKWRAAELFAYEETGTDILGNPVTERVSLGECMVRTSPYGTTFVESAGNSFDDSPLILVTPKPLKALKKASEAVLDGVVYSIAGVSELGRMRVVQLSVMKGEHA